MEEEEGEGEGGREGNAGGEKEGDEDEADGGRFRIWIRGTRVCAEG